MATAFSGGRHLPEVMIIGLISSYDAFLSRLLHVVIGRHPEIVLTGDKNIKLSELSTFASIDEVRTSLIDREIESVIRLSHHEQFDWMEKRFSVRLREQLDVWPEFVELCERRNLFTHTGGIVSKQYLDICCDHKCNTGSIRMGDKIAVNPAYFANAVKIVYEIGAKLCHVLWRKIAPDERERADIRLNEVGYNLIYTRAYKIAEPLLRFGVDVLKTHANDEVRRMMVVNLANTQRLQGKKEEAAKILDKEDWSACSELFKVCVAAVKEDIGVVVKLMEKIGVNGSPDKQDYRTWPVFRRIRTDERFMTTFEKLFRETVIAPEVANIELPQETGVQNDTQVPTTH